MSRIEYLLNALINGDDVKDFEPQSRCEAILKSCCTGEECNIEPESRIEALLKIVQTKIATSGDVSITDDGEGNVTITASGGASITDDGNGNVVIA